MKSSTAMPVGRYPITETLVPGFQSNTLGPHTPTSDRRNRDLIPPLSSPGSSIARVSTGHRVAR
eukprot:3880681-Rhodomonas_salina.1